MQLLVQPQPCLCFTSDGLRPHCQVRSSSAALRRLRGARLPREHGREKPIDRCGGKNRLSLSWYRLTGNRLGGTTGQQNSLTGIYANAIYAIKRVVTRYAAMSCSFFGAQHAVGCLVDCACFLLRPRGEAKTPAAAPQATIIKHSEMAKHRSVLPQQSPDDSKSCNRATTRQKGACGASRAFASTPYLRARLCFLGNPETMLRPTSPAPANQQN